MSIVDVVKKLGIDLEKGAVFGSGPICVRGLREYNDVDLLVTKEVFDEYRSQGTEFVTQTGNEGIKVDVDGIEVELFYEWAPGEWDQDKLIEEADVIEGVKFVKLKDVKKWKEIMGRDKDQKDVEIIINYLKEKK